MGRQPWAVFGLLKTSDADSPSVSTAEVVITLVGFTLLYGVLAVIAGRIFLNTARKGPAPEGTAEDAGPATWRSRMSHEGLTRPPGDLVPADLGPLARLLRARGLRLRGRDAHPRASDAPRPSAARCMHSIGPVWDGNKVWLIVAGRRHFAAFPQWYAALFSGFYLALFLILVGLIVRSVGVRALGQGGPGGVAHALGVGDHRRQLPAGAAVGRGLGQHRPWRADRLARRVHGHAVRRC